MCVCVCVCIGVCLHALCVYAHASARTCVCVPEYFCVGVLLRVAVRACVRALSRVCALENEFTVCVRVRVRVRVWGCLCLCLCACVYVGSTFALWLPKGPDHVCPHPLLWFICKNIHFTSVRAESVFTENKIDDQQPHNQIQVFVQRYFSIDILDQVFYFVVCVCVRIDTFTTII